MDLPALNGLRDSPHGLFRRAGHAFSVQLPLVVLQGAHLEVIPEKRRLHIPAFEGVDVHNMRFPVVDRQADIGEAFHQCGL